MSRARRTLAELITECQTLLGEPNSPFFTSDLLKIFFNQSQDRRLVELANAFEGWNSEIVSCDLVADQSTYRLPEGIGRLLRVVYVAEDGYERVLNQHRKGEGLWTTTGNTVEPQSYRLVGEFIEVTPPPAISLDDALKIEYETIPDRITDDADKIPAAWPVTFETLLVLDTCIAALDYESAQAAGDERGPLVASFMRRRSEIEAALSTNVSERAAGRLFGSPFDWGS